ncbi:AHH domain-containing protein [Lysinibacillus xylanilyticus]|uniref:AHH domain-containing protein n=1 Tax=Lysinibacillus xylanilyticus TaxID=582475 RepID=UPI003D03525B
MLGDYPSAQKERDILKQYDIDVNSADNGVYLKNIDPNSLQPGVYHRVIHTKAYLIILLIDWRLLNNLFASIA